MGTEMKRNEETSPVDMIDYIRGWDGMGWEIEDGMIDKIDKNKTRLIRTRTTQFMSTRIYLGAGAVAAVGLLAYQMNQQQKQYEIPVTTSEKLKKTIWTDSNANAMRQRDGENISLRKEKNKSTSQSIFNWGFNEAERIKAISIGEYDKANKIYNDLLKEFNDSKNGFFDKGNSVLKQHLEDAKITLNDKKLRLDNATIEYNKHVQSDFNKLSNKLDELDEINRKQGFFKWLFGGGTDTREGKEEDKPIKKNSVETAQIVKQSLHGWGENAEEFAKESMQDELNNKENYSPSNPQQKLNELKSIKEKGWFTYNKGPSTELKIADNAAKGLKGWGETASQFSEDEIYEAKKLNSNYIKELNSQYENFKEKEINLKNNTLNWYQKWFKSSKLYDLAKNDYDLALKNYEDAKKKFNDNLDTITEDIKK